MIKLKLLFFFLFLSFLTKGQTYNVHYEEIIFSNDVNLELMSKELLKRREKNQQTKSILTTTSGSSVYQQDVDLLELEDSDNPNTSIYIARPKEYRNQASKLLLQYYKNYEPVIYGEDVYVKNELPVYDWEILEQTETIAGYTCKLAKTKYSDGTSVLAWFTDEIPINEGPRDLWGLPGLIVQAQINERVLVVAVKIVKEEELIEIIFPTPEKTITPSEFSDLKKHIFRPRTITTPDGRIITIGRS